jgi:PilZ domain
MSLERSGAEYLRRLKADQESPLAPSHPCENTITQLSPATPADSGTGPERRLHPRYKCEGSAEFRVGGTDVRTWGTFTDLSLNGCYVEMTATFPVGSIVDLNLELNGLQARTQGEVRVSYPFLGMGIAFREMTEEDRVHLQAMVRSLLPSSRVVGNRPPGDPEQPAETLPVIVNPAAALQALVEFFDERAVMSKDEFLRTLRRSQNLNR